MKQVLRWLLLGLLLGGGCVRGQSFVEAFEAGSLPAGWSVRSAPPASGGWQFGPATAARSAYFRPPASAGLAYVNYDRCGPACGQADDLLAPLTEATGRVAYLEFDYFFTATAADGTRERAWLLLADAEGAITDTVLRIGASGNSWRRVHLRLPRADRFRLVFRTSDGGGWGRGFALDRVRLSLLGQPAATIDWAAASRLLPLHREDSIRVRVRNRSRDTLRRIAWTWQLDTFPPIPEVSNGLLIPPDSAAVLVATQPFVLHQARAHRLTLRLTQLNSFAPADPDSARADLRLVGLTAPLPPRRRLLELYTAHTCSSCPLTDFRRDDFVARNRQVVPVSIHTEGRMSIPFGRELAARFGVNELPHAVFDRRPDSSRTDRRLPAPDWEAKIREAWEPAPARVYLASKRFQLPDLETQIEVEALSELQGDFRLACLVLADTVLQLDSQFEQASDFNGIPQDDLFRTATNPAGLNPFAGRGNPIRDYVHRHVLIGVLGTNEGLPLPASLQAGARLRRPLPDFRLPSYVRADQLRLVPLLLRATPAGLEVAQLGFERIDERRIGTQADTVLSCGGDTLTLSAWSTAPNPTFRWLPRPGLIDTAGAVVRVAPRQTTAYVVQALSDRDTLEATVRVVVGLGVNFITNRRFAPDSLAEFEFINLTPNSDSLTFRWFAGDSLFSEEKNPVHIFGRREVYSIRLIATTRDSACSDTLTRREWIAVGVGRGPRLGQRDTWRLWPNPAAERARVTWERPLQQTGWLQLYNLHGQEIRRWMLPAGSTAYDLDLENLPAGLYLLRSTAGGTGLRLLRE